MRNILFYLSLVLCLQSSTAYSAAAEPKEAEDARKAVFVPVKYGGHPTEFPNVFSHDSVTLGHSVRFEFKGDSKTFSFTAPAKAVLNGLCAELPSEIGTVVGSLVFINNDTGAEGESWSWGASQIYAPTQHVKVSSWFNVILKLYDMHRGGKLGFEIMPLEKHEVGSSPSRWPSKLFPSELFGIISSNA